MELERAERERRDRDVVQVQVEAGATAGATAGAVRPVDRQMVAHLFEVSCLIAYISL